MRQLKRGPLKKDVTTHFDTTTKSEILNSQFLSAFTTKIQADFLA